MQNKLLIEATRQLLEPFKVYGKPANEAFTEGQCVIAGAIIFRIHPRIVCLAPTGYGKSEAVALGVMIRSCFSREDFIIASVKYGTSDIIMEKVIDHIFDDEFVTYQMELEKGMRLDRLRRERKKNKITYREGGSIRIISLHGKEEDLSKSIGQHAPNIVLDESPLLTPTKYFQVLKILEGTGKYEDSFLFELGNAVNRNHFMQNLTTSQRHYKIIISLEQAIAEGRLDPESVEEKRGMPFFEQFYLNKFPDENEIDERGYRQLLTDDDIKNAFIDSVEDEDDKMLGIDIGAGGDLNVFTVRGHKYAFFDRENKSNDTMTNVGETEEVMEKREIVDDMVFIDDIGIGRGASDRLKERGHEINAVSVGSKSSEPEKYMNLKAECYWNARMWIKNGGKLLRDERWHQLTWIKYKISSDKVLQIEAKEDLKKRTGKSPDHAESFMLTFAPNEPVGMEVL